MEELLKLCLGFIENNPIISIVISAIVLVVLVYLEIKKNYIKKSSNS